MDEALPVLYALAAVAIYQEKGVVEALAYLQQQGYTPAEAIDLIALYDSYVDFVKRNEMALLMKRPH
jgi:phosphosulfolactate synthase (CoM biosynthesis protein A)